MLLGIGILAASKSPEGVPAGGFPYYGPPVQEYLPAAAGQVHRIGRHGHAGQPSAKFLHDAPSGFQGGAEMAGPGGQVSLEKVVGLHPQPDQPAEKPGQGIAVVV